MDKRFLTLFFSPICIRVLSSASCFEVKPSILFCFLFSSTIWLKLFCLQVEAVVARIASGGKAVRAGRFALSECFCRVTEKDEEQLNRFADAWLCKGQLLRITTRNILSSHSLWITMVPAGTSQDKYTSYQLMSFSKHWQTLRLLNKNYLTKKRFIQ